MYVFLLLSSEDTERHLLRHIPVSEKKLLTHQERDFQIRQFYLKKDFPKYQNKKERTIRFSPITNHAMTTLQNLNFSYEGGSNMFERITVCKNSYG